MVARLANELLGWNPVLAPGVVAPTFTGPTIGGVVVESLWEPGLKDLGIDRRVYHPVNHSANQADEFGELFWRNHWHIRPQLFAMGNVLTDQQREFFVHNAYRTSQNITLITETGATGITLEDNGTPSFAVNAQSTVTYDLDIDSAGPAVINYEADFDFTVGTLSVFVTGVRVVVFPFQPQSPLTEVWEWNTDVIESADGTEQRNSMRDIPSQTWLFRLLDGNEQRTAKIENLFYGWVPTNLALPVTVDETALTAAVGIGDIVLPVVTTDDSHFEDGREVLIMQDEDTFETGLIASHTSTSITIDVALTAAWPINTPVFPVQIVKFGGRIGGRLWPINAREYTFEFRNVFPVDYSDESTFNTYKTFPIWEDDWTIGQTYTRQFNHSVIRTDPGTGKFFDHRKRSYPLVSTNMIIPMDGRTAWWRIKRFIHARRGKQKVFWISSRRPDFFLQSDSVSLTEIHIAHLYYASQVFTNSLALRRNLEITYTDGTVDLREITNAVEVSDVQETLTVDSNMSQLATAANIEQISYLYLVRLDTDSLSFAHRIKYHGDLGVPMVEVVG